MKVLSALLLFCAHALAHDHNAPELDQWYQSLTNGLNSPCCDGSDALSVEDPDWDTVGASEDFPYRVFIRGQWIKVYKNVVVKANNRAGIAKVWPIFVNGQPPAIQCFLPGSFS